MQHENLGNMENVGLSCLSPQKPLQTLIYIMAEKYTNIVM